MYRIQLATGLEAIYRSLEELAVSVQNGIVCPDALVYHRGKTEVGHITSAMWSPTCKANIALAMLRRPYGEEITQELSVEIYVKKELKWARQMARCRIVPRPFFDHPRRRATPAGAF